MDAYAIRGVSEVFDKQFAAMGNAVLGCSDLSGSDGVCAFLAANVGSQAGEYFADSGRGVRHTIKFPLMMKHDFECGDFEAAKAWAVAWPKAAYAFLVSVERKARAMVMNKDDIADVRTLLDDAGSLIKSMTCQIEELESELVDKTECRMAM